MKMKYGAQKRLAKAIGMRPTQLCDLLHGRRRMYGDIAVALEDASKSVLGKKVSARRWIEMNQEEG